MIWVIGSVQFINILDFMMVAPLGPFLAKDLGVAPSNLGLLIASYTLSAGVAGLLGSLVLDRFDRRKALCVSLLGLMIGTALGGVASNFHWLLGARLLAGFFGGPATSLSISIVADLIPPERRGRAMGAVMSAFSVASVLGVPIGLILAERGGWRLPFFAVGAAGLLLTAFAYWVLPPLRGHLKYPGQLKDALSGLRHLASRKLVRASWAMTGLSMLAGFLIVPNFPTYLTQNLGLPLTGIKSLYAIGGATSFLVMRLSGRWVDRYGSYRVGSFASVLLMGVLFFYTVHFIPGTPVLLMFVAFMAAMGFRNVSISTLASKVPEGFERARFQSVQSAVQHAASALGGILSAWILSLGPRGELRHMDIVGGMSIVLTGLMPFVLRGVEHGLHGKTSAQPLASANPLLTEPVNPPAARAQESS